MKTAPIILNIGLARNDGQPNHTLEHVVAELTRSGLIVQSGARVVQSDTEPTAVLRLTPATVARHSMSSLHHTLHLVACFLNQDCIAIHDTSHPATYGALVGPKAKEWGEFNPELFLLEDGGPLV
jgi:hypothetical protein